MQLKSTQQVPANAELIAKMVELGNLGQNVRITGETKEERLKSLEKFIMVQKIQATVTLNELFADLSKELGFSDEDLARYENDVFGLLEMWEE